MNDGDAIALELFGRIMPVGTSPHRETRKAAWSLPSWDRAALCFSEPFPASSKWVSSRCASHVMGRHWKSDSTRRGWQVSPHATLTVIDP